MAARSPVQDTQEALSYEEQLEAIPELPPRPVLYASDFPADSGDGLSSVAEAKYTLQRYEQERDSRQALSGYLANPYGCRGPLSPREERQQLEEAEEYRRNRYGLEDSPTDNPVRPIEGGGKPFRF